jgi:anti-sigma factor RsiW
MEVESLLGPYLDSELDTHTTERVRQHLEQCSACSSRFQVDTRFEAALKRQLNTLPRTPDLWREQESFVVAAFGQKGAPTQRREHTKVEANPIDWLARWREWLWPNPAYYAGLASAWAILLIVQLTSAEPSRETTSSEPPRPLTPEIRMLLSEQRQTLQTLLTIPEAEGQPAEESQPAPRSEQIRKTTWG